MALVYIRPDADSVDGSWVNASGSATNLYDSVDETVASDADYIRSSNNPANDIVKLRLSNFASTPVEPMTVRYRFKKVVSAGEVLSMKARLLQASTTIAEWEHSEVVDTYVDAEQELTTAQFNAISDFTDLYLEFEAITGALEIDSFSASYLLTDESTGFAINATYPGDPLEADYVGALMGGSVKSTSYNNKPLDAANLTQAGTSAKMVHWNEAPYVRWTPHNHVKQSQTLATTWATTNSSVTSDAVTAPDGTTTADKIASNTTSSVWAGIYQVNHMVIPAAIPQVTASVYAKAAELNKFSMAMGNDTTSGRFGLAIFDLSDGTIGTTGNGTDTAADVSYHSSSITSVGSGWYRCSVTINRTDGQTNGLMRLGLETSKTNTINGNNYGQTTAWSQTSGNGMYFWGAQVVQGINPLPYLVTTSSVPLIGIPQGYDIDYDIFGMLTEPAATNLVIRSETFDTGWTNEGSSDTANSTVSPDGATTADTVTATAGGGTSHHIYSTSFAVAAGSGNPYTASVYLKQGTATHAAVIISHVSTTTEWFGATFSLSTWAVTQSSDGALGTTLTTAVTPVGDGWYRLSVTGYLNNGTNAVLGIHPLNTGTPTHGDYGNVTWTAVGTETLYAWGAQVELVTSLSTAPTTYVPTISASATRAADNISVLTSTFAYDKTAWTVYLDFKQLSTVTDRYFWMLYGSVGGERYQLHTDAYGFDSAGVATGLSISTGVSNVANTRQQITCGFAVNDGDASVNGGAITSDATCSVPTNGATDFYIFNTQVPDGHPTGFVYRVVYVPAQVETRDGNIETWRYAF